MPIFRGDPKNDPTTGLMPGSVTVWLGCMTNRVGAATPPLTIRRSSRFGVGQKQNTQESQGRAGKDQSHLGHRGEQDDREAGAQNPCRWGGDGSQTGSGGSTRPSLSMRRNGVSLEELKRLDEQGEIDPGYLDESGFCLVPYLPYAWQDLGKRWSCPANGVGAFNVLGLMNRRNELAPLCVYAKHYE